MYSPELVFLFNPFSLPYSSLPAYIITKPVGLKEPIVGNVVSHLSLLFDDLAILGNGQ